MSLLAQSDREFWFAAPEVTQGHGDRPILFRFTSSNKPAQITISQPANPNFPPIILSINPFSTQTVDITPFIDIAENKPGNTKLNYGFLITATNSITAYYEVGFNNNAEIFPLKGYVAKGLEFLIPGQVTFNNRIPLNPTAHNGFVIVATEDDTNIQIELTHPDEFGNRSIPIKLNKGQTYAVNAASELANLHLGGSVITSDKPICISIYDDSIFIGGSYDLVGDQIVPIKNTGSLFVIVRGALNYNLNTNTDYYYVWATENNTEIKVDGLLVATINRGANYSGQLKNNTAFVETSKPCYIFQLTGTGQEATGTSLPSITCTGSQSVSFVRSTSELFYLNLLCKTEDIGNFSIDGNPNLITPSMFSVVPGSSGIWQYARINVSSLNLNNIITTSAATSVTNSTGLFHLGFLNGGNASGSRLGYFSNYAQVALAPVITSTSCLGSNISLSATSYPNVNYQWTGPNQFSSTIANPTIINATLQDSGMYFVVANINGCGVSEDSVRVEVHPAPTIHFIKSLDTVCIGATKDIHYSLNGKAPWTLEYSNGISNTRITNISVAPNFFTVSPTVNTIYSVVNITDSNSCVVSVNANNEKDTMVVNPLPIPLFSTSSIKCEQKDILFIDESTANLDSITHWYWDLGNGQIRNETSKTAFNEQYGAWGQYQIKLAVQSRLGCRSDTLIESIYINPNPLIGVEMPEVCLSDKFAQFMDTSSLADHNANTFYYQWNFNVTPVPGKIQPTIPMSAFTAQNPIVQYNDFGDYKISLRLTHQSTGCISTDTLDFRVNGAVPKAQFKIVNDTALCSNQAVKIIDSSWVDFGSIGKLVINWGDGSPDSVVNDPVIDPTLNKTYQHFYSNSSAPNNLNYPIQVTAYSGGSCLIGVTHNISIVPPPERPIIQTAKNYLCLMDSLLLNTSTQGGAPSFKYSYVSDNQFASISGKTIKGLVNGLASLSLEVTDIKNCVYPFNNIFNINVVDIPKAIISAADTVICNGDSVTLTGSGTDAILYQWFRNDTLVSNTYQGSYRHNNAGNYKLVVNDGKCNSLPTGVLKIAPFDITPYSFSYLPTTCVGTSLLINTNAIEQSNVHYKWDFGDGINYLKAKPVAHKYFARGDYTIKLDVTNDYCPKYFYQVVGKAVKIVSAVQPQLFKFFFSAYQDTTLITKIDPGYTKYHWTPSTFLSSNNIPNPNFNGDKSIDYTLSRTDTLTSCAVTDEYEIVVSTEVYVNVPNAFSPNGDGLNDVLKVEYGAGVVGAFGFKIFNRWGQLVFQSSDINMGWNGRNQNGVLQEIDGYTYLLTYRYKNYKTGEELPIQKTGSFILFR